MSAVSLWTYILRFLSLELVPERPSSLAIVMIPTAVVLGFISTRELEISILKQPFHVSDAGSQRRWLHWILWQ